MHSSVGKNFSNELTKKKKKWKIKLEVEMKNQFENLMSGQIKSIILIE